MLKIDLDSHHAKFPLCLHSLNFSIFRLDLDLLYPMALSWGKKTGITLFCYDIEGGHFKVVFEEVFLKLYFKKSYRSMQINRFLQSTLFCSFVKHI